MTKFTITNTVMETPITLLVWANFTPDKDESFRFPLNTTYAEIISTLQARCDEMDAQEEARKLAFETLSEQLIQE